MYVGASAKDRATLVPPLDVAWVWHCHMLCPEKYVFDMDRIADSSRSFFIMLLHRLRGAKDFVESTVASQKYWQTCAPNENITPK